MYNPGAMKCKKKSQTSPGSFSLSVFHTRAIFCLPFMGVSFWPLQFIEIY